MGTLVLTVALLFLHVLLIFALLGSFLLLPKQSTHHLVPPSSLGSLGAHPIESIHNGAPTNRQSPLLRTMLVQELRRLPGPHVVFHPVSDQRFIGAIREDHGGSSFVFTPWVSPTIRYIVVVFCFV